MEFISSYSLLQMTAVAWDMAFLILKDLDDQNDPATWLSCWITRILRDGGQGDPYNIYIQCGLVPLNFWERNSAAHHTVGQPLQ